MNMNPIPLQPASLDIWEKKYCLRDKDGVRVDTDINATLDRVARELAGTEKTAALRKKHEKSFRDALSYGAIPAGRILSNAGATDHKKAVSLINCTVSDTISDSMDSILNKLTEAGMTLKSGCGIGYEFSTLRPRGSYVHGAGSNTSGPLSFMDIYDKMCFTISSAGGRRGAQMATFDVTHPDVLEFITAKREAGRFRQFNLSLLITDEFVSAVRDDRPWAFKWEGQTMGEPMQARALWDIIMRSNYDFAEPGFLLIDRINHFNNLWFCEHLRATNPCGEQPLPPYGSCLLGSLNLTMFVEYPFTPKARFDWAKFYSTVGVFTRMLDNVVPLSGLPLPQQQWEIESKRRHGMGFLGLGSTLIMLGMTYGDPESLVFTSQVSRYIALAGFETGAMLAQEKGEAPVLQRTYTSREIEPFLKYNTNNFTPKTSKGRSPAAYTGRELFLQSHYFDVWREDTDAKVILKLMGKHGSRFTHHSSLAPTGTISLSLGNNASNGIEPSFAHSYGRNIIREGRNAKEYVEVSSYEYLAYKTHINPEATTQVLPVGAVADEATKNFLPSNFTTTDGLTPRQHVDVQAAAQVWVDSSISKTINVPTDIDFEAFKDIYMYAYDKGLKGCTTFRFNPEAFQGVLVKSEDLKSTMYVFTLEDGSTVEHTGDTMIEYAGQTQTAANLYDALKEGYFGKF